MLKRYRMFVLSAGRIPRGVLECSPEQKGTRNACNVPQQTLSIAGQQYFGPSSIR
jgi:hypothetical protein